ncbi:MAG: hypothetical protein KG003_15685 [Bacteroidetes bacterium]|nr:hypothetical protein [Bacteroidota bacterium]
MFLSKTQVTIAFTIVSSLFFSCVSVKKYEAQNADILQLKTDLKQADSKLISQNMQLNLVRDSIQLLQKQEKEKAIFSTYNLFKNTSKAGDYSTSVVYLNQLLQLDSSQAYWIYDSLAFYHYLYLMTPGGSFVPKSALVYAEQGLKLNPQNEFLIDIRAKMLLLFQNDKEALAIYNDLWEKTGDNTYLWNIAYIHLIIYQDVKKTESIVSEVLKSPNVAVKKVRITAIDERRVDQIPSKAAFLFLRGLMQANSGQLVKATKTLEEVVKMAPEYTTAKRYLMEVKNAMYRQ